MERDVHFIFTFVQSGCILIYNQLFSQLALFLLHLLQFLLQTPLVFLSAALKEVVVPEEGRLANVQQDVEWDVEGVDELLPWDHNESNEAAKQDQGVDNPDPGAICVETAFHLFVVVLKLDSLDVV